MYCKHYGFREKPFNITPNPRFLFLSKNHKEAFAHLLYGIDNHSGFIELTGEVGTGKTTVLRTILGQLEENRHRSALILNPCLSAVELLRNINREFGIAFEGLENGSLLAELNSFLLAENRAGRTVVLVIDEAQNLQPDVLEQVRLISNLETESDKLLQIILVGQPELDRLLARPELRQLAQRITVHYHLLPLDFEDSCSYIRHRLNVAGGGAWVSFSGEAERLVFKFSKGSPRLLNIVCDRCLLIGYTEDTQQISGEIAAAAVRELTKKQALTITPGVLNVITACVTLSAIAGGIYFLWKPSAPKMTVAAKTVPLEAKQAAPAVPKEIKLPAPVKPAAEKILPPPAPAPAPAPAPVPAPVPAAKAETVPAPWQSLPTGGADAVNAIARSWLLPPTARNSGSRGIAALAAQAGLNCLPVNGRLNSLLAMDLPVVVEIRLPEKRGNRFLAITEAGRDRVRITPALAGRSEIPRREIEPLLSGNGFILWKNHQNIPVDLALDAAGIDVIRLQMLLIGAGFFKNEPSGILDQPTVDALNSFRKTHKLKADSRLDQKTLLLLYRTNASLPTPRLGARNQT